MPAPEQEEVTLLPRNPPVADGLEKIVSCFGELHTPGVGGLAQAWMPTHMRRQAENLETKGMPYAILGPGDMLPCFRALCCKYSFTTDLRKLHLMGAPGRVYMSGQAETSDNVQQFSQRIYPVLSEAKACSVSATVVLPIFADAQRAKAVAVLELFQFNGPGFGYKTVFDWANRHLRAAGLYTAGMETQAFEMQSHALSFDFFCKQSSVLSSLDFMFSSKANSPANSSVAPAKKCQKMHHTGSSDAQGLEVSQRQLGSISSKPAPTEQNESSPDLSTLGRAFLSQHYSGVSPEAVHGTTPQQQPQAQGSVVSQPVAPATVAEEPPPPDMPAYSAPEAAAVSAEQQPMQSFSQDATAEEMEEQQRFESQEMLPPDWGDPTAYRFVSQEMVPSPGPCSGESAEPFGYLGPHWGNLGAEASHALNNLQSKQVVPVSGIFNDLYPMAPLKRKVDKMTAEPKDPVLALGRRHSSTTRLESDADDAEEPLAGRRDAGVSLQPGEVHNKKTLTREVLEAHFGGTLAEAAAALGVCSTTLKRACRRHGIAAWPRKTRYLSRQTQEAARPQPQPVTAADAGRNGFAAAHKNFSAATRSHDTAFDPALAAGAMLSNDYGSENCNSEPQASMTVAPGDLPFSRPVQGMQLPIDSQDFEPSYAEHASFIPDRDAGARALFHEAHILAEPPSLSEGSGPPSAGMAPRYVQDKSLKESVAELETLFLDSGLDTNWHPPASAAGSTARLEVRAGGACNSAASPATDAFPEVPEAWLETAFLCN